jgi:glycosyltransferase involved in cell wall biosynthesis
MNAPWLTVILPTHNGEAFLRTALDSIGNEYDPEIEVIAIDDGSTDSTLSLLGEYESKLPLTVIERPIGSWVENTNLGIERARGEWLCFLHQDDAWRPGRLKAIRTATARQPALIVHAADFIDQAGNTVGQWRCPLPNRGRDLRPESTLARLLVQNFVPLPSAVFRRDDADRVGRLNPELWFTADWDFWLKLAARGRTVYLSEPLAAFRLHGESQTASRFDRPASMRQQLESVFDSHWSRWRNRLPAPWRIEAAARLSREVNLALAARYHSQRPDWPRLLSAMAAGPGTWSYYLHNSRIVERVVSRLKVNLQPPH